MIVYTLGTAAPVFIMSLIKSPVVSAKDDSTSGRDFSIFFIVKEVGVLVGTPLLTALWVQGLEVGGLEFGLPFFVTSVDHTLRCC